MNKHNCSVRQKTHRLAIPIILALSISLLSHNGYAFSPGYYFQQDKTLKGRITDEQGQPVYGVTVTVAGTKRGATTNQNGEYIIQVSKGEKLSFSNVGYEVQTITVGDGNETNLTLKVQSASLSDVVVVGYGTTKKATLTGAVSSIKGKEVTQSPATNVSNSLVGRLPGLTAVQGSGEPGYDGSLLRIRGSNTLNDNGVLVVIDGIAGRSLERIDPYSIESVTILKDASAAIYGNQAANGVILITTRRGKTGKPEITFNASMGYNQPTKIPEMADAATYATMLNEIASYAGAPAKYTGDEIQKFKDGSDPWRYPNTDWFKATLKTKSAQNSYNVNVSGGTESLSYFVSIGARTQDGNYYHSGTKFNQYDLRTNIDGKISKNISLTFDVAGRMEDRNYPVRGAGAIFRMVMRGKPTLPAYWPDGTPGPDIEYGDNPVVISTDATGYDHDKYYALNSNLKLNINIPWVKGLSLSGVAAIDKGFDFRKTWQTPWYLYTADFNNLDPNGNPTLTKGKRGFDDPRLFQYSRDEFSRTLYGLINYETKIAGDHSIKVTAGAEHRKGNQEYFSAFRRYFASTAIDQLFAGGSAEINNGGSGSVNERFSYLGRVNYGYKDKYLAEFVWRYDGSYIFPSFNKQYGFFPGVSLGWRVSEEDFLKGVPFISNLKLRASWGQTGNDRIPEWQYLSSYSYGNILGSPYLPFVTNGTTENQTTYEVHVPNENVTWEVVNQTDIGFDLGLFNNKLTIEADYFSYKRSQLLWPSTDAVPASTGMVLPYTNYGKVNNGGFEFNITYRNKAGALDYFLGFNGGYAKNKILKWNERPNKPSYQTAIGHPMPSNPDPNNPDAGEYYQAIGIYHTDADLGKYVHVDGARAGDIIFEDVNKDGKIDDLDKVRSYKSNIPVFTAGVNLGVQYKGFDVSILLQAAAGAVNYINTESGEIGNFLESFAEKRWTQDNPNASGPRTFNRGNEYWVGRANTYWLKKTDYIRLKNLQIGYSLPQNINKKVGIRQFRIYVGGYNLLTYAPDYKDFDPEASAGSGQSYPLQRVLTAGVTLTF